VLSVAEEPAPEGALASTGSRHELRPNAVSLTGSVVIGVATSAPGQSSAVAMAAMVAVAAYATGPAILIAMVPMLAIALCYQRLNLFEQNCGGPYVWAARAISPYVGYLVAWSMLVGFVLGSVSDILPLGPAMLALVGLDPGGVAGNVLSASVFGLLMTAVAAVGIRATARLQMVFAVVEYAVLLAFSVLGFLAVFVHHDPGTVHPSLHWATLSGVGGKGSLGGAMLVAIYLFTGWDASAYVNEETENRVRNPGRAVLCSVAILGPLYAWIFVSLQGAVPAKALQSHAGDSLVYIAQVLAGNNWAKAMILALVLSVLGTVQGTIVATSRVTYAMGTDRLLPRPFALVHHRFRTPLVASFFWGAVMIVIADLYVVSSSLATAFDDVVNAEAVAFVLFYMATALSTVVYYRRMLTRGLADALLVGVVPLGGAAMLGWVLYKSLPGLNDLERYTLIGIGAAGVVLMFVTARLVKAPFFSLRRSAYSPDESPAGSD